MSVAPLDDLFGFRRRFRITPAEHSVRAEVEDDFHCMSVTIRHRDGLATAIESAVVRAPWTTCPGAVSQLEQTFTNVRLDEFAARGEKLANCTHLHDLATLGAAHAADNEPLVYDILVSDPVDGRRRSELRRNGVTLMSWVLEGMRVVEPSELGGMTLDKLGAWISSLDPQMREAARVLRWGTMIAHGRTIPLEQQSDATKMPVGNCYTFQPQRSIRAKRVGEIRDFSRGTARPLEPRRAVSQASS
jgi:hypothetical protein